MFTKEYDQNKEQYSDYFGQPLILQNRTKNNNGYENKQSGNQIKIFEMQKLQSQIDELNRQLKIERNELQSISLYTKHVEDTNAKLEIQRVIALNQCLYFKTSIDSLLKDDELIKKHNDELRLENNNLRLTILSLKKNLCQLMKSVTSLSQLENTQNYNDNTDNNQMMMSQFENMVNNLEKVENDNEEMKNKIRCNEEDKKC